MAANKADPAFRVVAREKLPDGRTKHIMANGCISYSAPLPGGDWSARKARELSNMMYEILRKAAANQANSDSSCT